MSSPREELLKIQRRLWRRNKDIIENSILVKEPGFVEYEKKYLKAVSNLERVATNDEMVASVKAARLIFVGDYHTCNQSQRSFLRLLKNIATETPNIIIGLELIHRRHQQHLDHLITGRIDEETFIKKVGLRQHWVFDLWANFKPLFDFARYHDLKLFGIDAASRRAGLKERDHATAGVIADILKKYPEHKLFVLIGDLHLAHLPDEVRKKLSNLNELILFQNSESIYWKLAEQGLEDRVEVVKIDEKSFCRMHTPPIVCQQSYINWLEHEEGEIDYSDAKTSFLELVDNICRFMEIDLRENREKVEVYTCGDLSFFRQLNDIGKFSANELRCIKRQILASESYFIPEKRIVYLANLSINHAAEEAAHFIKHVCSGLERPREPMDAFYANILHEGLAFFGSKLINHKRKCLHQRDFEGLIAYFSTIEVPNVRLVEFETAHIVLEFLKLGGLKFDISNFKRFLNSGLFFSVTHALGYMLGDKLFYGLMSERVAKDEIRRLFYEPWRKKGEPALVYNDLKDRLKGIKVPKRI